MIWFKTEVQTLRSDRFLYADHAQLGIWLLLIAYCCEQENGGRIKDACGWTKRHWALLGLDQPPESTSLFEWDDRDIVVFGYDSTYEDKCRGQRDRARAGGVAKAQATALATARATARATASPVATADATPVALATASRLALATASAEENRVEEKRAEQSRADTDHIGGGGGAALEDAFDAVERNDARPVITPTATAFRSLADWFIMHHRAFKKDCRDEWQALMDRAGYDLMDEAYAAAASKKLSGPIFVSDLAEMIEWEDE